MYEAFPAKKYTCHNFVYALTMICMKSMHPETLVHTVLHPDVYAFCSDGTWSCVQGYYYMESLWKIQ